MHFCVKTLLNLQTVSFLFSGSVFNDVTIKVRCQDSCFILYFLSFNLVQHLYCEWENPAVSTIFLYVLDHSRMLAKSWGHSLVSHLGFGDNWVWMWLWPPGMKHEQLIVPVTLWNERLGGEGGTNPFSCQGRQASCLWQCLS